MIHKEGYPTILLTLIVSAVLIGLVYWFVPQFIALGVLAALILLGLVLQFFRNPTRQIPSNSDSLVYAPADGKVVVIEETEEPEYFQQKRLQISIFMSPTNVHVNRNPIAGTVNYVKHHHGKYLVAWHPKSSTENERTTVVIGGTKAEILLRQIAGAMAKRIVNYLQKGDQVEQGSEMGFIKFGSRVDLYLPLDAKIEVAIGDKVKGNQTVIAELK